MKAVSPAPFLTGRFRKNASGPGLLAVFLLLLALLGVFSILSLPAMAQGTQKPLNLGTIIQKSTKGAPKPRSYIKLPETMPPPRANPQASGTGTSRQPAAPGQIAPGGVFGNGDTGSQPGTAKPSAPNGQTGEAGQPSTPPSTDGQQPNGQQQGNQPSSKPEVTAPEIEPGGIANLQLTALLSENGEILQRGVTWRVYKEKRDKTGHLPLVHEGMAGQINIELDPGAYIVYSGYGYANLTKRVVLNRAGNYGETFVLRAGALRLNAVAAGDIPLDENLLSFNIYNRNDSGSGNQELVAKNVKARHVVKLTEGTYHIVSSYGTSNAKIRGDVEVKAGKLINVTMVHRAAKVTLRLVSEPGGEALANTVWTVLTPGGDVVKRAIGAFPTLALAEGDYTAIAKQNDEIYNRDFSVDSGLDRDIEVLAKVR